MREEKEEQKLQIVEQATCKLPQKKKTIVKKKVVYKYKPRQKSRIISDKEVEEIN